MPEERPYEKYELKIKAWEKESKEVAENEIIRLSETVLPDGSICMQHQLIEDGLFTVCLVVENDYQVLNINSDYLDSFNKLLDILHELMFGAPAQPQQPVYPGGMRHGENKPADAEELKEEEGADEKDGEEKKG